MLTPLSQRPFHSLKLWTSNVKDRICYLFFKTLSLLSSTSNEYAIYYSKKLSFRKISLALYSNHLIQTSFNRLYPGKQTAIPTPHITNHDYELDNIEMDANPSISGLCSGACIDYMNRVKSSKKSFWETIDSTALKFTDGCTKKGFVNHYSLNQITTTDSWTEKKLENPSFKDIYYAKTVSFFAQNYKSKFYKSDLDNYEDIPSGDYFLREKSSNKEEGLHVVCLYKRNEGTVVFDTNFGTLFFEDHHKLLSYLTRSTKIMFNAPVNFTLFHCKDKDESC